MDAEQTVRRATVADVECVTDIVTRAFAKDPLWSWALSRPDGKTDHVRAFWRLFVEGALRYPSSSIAEDNAAVAVWIPPGQDELTAAQEDQLGEHCVAHLGSRSERCLELLARMEEVHPREVAHYYLSLLATHPDRRGQGIGMRLLAHDLAAIDAEHVPAYLESSNPANNARYQKLGFEPVREIAAPGQGPMVTTMWRPAR
jgi:ribosomal protein S18 acetylase RimI-like enzyme